MKPMDQPTSEPAGIETMGPWQPPFPRDDWERTPASVRLFVVGQQQTIEALTKRVDEL